MLKQLSPSYHKLIRSRYLLPISDTLGRDTRIEDGYVLIEGNQILEVGHYDDYVGKRIIEEYGSNLQIIGSYDDRDIPLLNGVILPSFCKAHGHDYQSNLIGIAKDTTLTEWLDETVNPFSNMMHFDCYEELTDYFSFSPYYLTSLKGKLDDIYSGITSSLSHHCDLCKFHVPELAQATLDCGVTIVIAVGSEDRLYPEIMLDHSIDEVIARLDTYYEEWDNDSTVFIIPGPDQFFSNSEEFFIEQKKWSLSKNRLLSTHSSEEPATTQFFIEEFGMTPVEYGERCGVLDEYTILAHQVNSTPNDLQIIKDTGANVVHNPLANALLGSGMPPVLEMLDLGIPMAISTDSSGASDNVNIINAARLASQYQKAYYKDATLLPAQKVLEMITIEPAKILRLNKGSLEAGKDADLIMIDLDPIHMTPTLKETVIENIIWATFGNEISYVMANGNLLMEDYEIKLDIDVDQVKKETRKLTQFFLEYKKNTAKVKGTGAHF